MKILIYLGHPAQFHFFKNIIKQLYANGHKVKILMKTKDILEDLLVSNEFEYENIQAISRKNNKISILFAALQRTFRVVRLARKFDADLLIGTDSSIAQTGFLLRRPAITTLEDDFDVISKLAKLTYPFSNSIVVPQVCSVGKWESKKVGYNGYMKLAYLHPNHFTPDKRIVKIYTQSEKYCIIRLAKLTAHHDLGINGLNSQLVKQIISIAELKGYKVYISSEAIIANEFSNYMLKINENHIHHLIAYASLLVSDSQSMSVEAAMLGTPSIRYSDFAGRISVLEELENKYQLTFGICTKHADKLLEKVNELLAYDGLAEIFRDRRCKMIHDKIDVTAFMVWLIEDYPHSVTVLERDSDFQYQFKSSSKMDTCKDIISAENAVFENGKQYTQNHPKVSSSIFLPSIVTEWDFSLSIYRKLLETLQQSGYAFYTFEDWCLGLAEGKYVILRHDVDLKASHSLATAKIEAEMGIRASYYFRVVPQSNQPQLIKAIVRLKHEIGYHYEDMSIFKGDVEKSIAHFIRQLNYFRQFYPVKTISMHGSPASKWDNRDLWKTYNYRDYGILGEPYMDLLTSDALSKGKIVYFTDTARMWDGDKYNVRDKRIMEVRPVKVNAKVKRKNIHTTFEFIEWLTTKPAVNAMMITTHPQRWTNNVVEWFEEYVMQNVKNLVKQLFYVQK